MTRSLVILGLIFALGLFLRIYNLSGLPLNIHTDEVSAGYVGYKIVQTGSDIHGNFLPLYINKFGDFRPAGIFYLLGAFSNIFGLSAFTIRFPTAFIGALTLISLYFLARQISGNKKIALLSAFLLAVSPWHIVVSRATSEQVVALFLLISGASILLHSLSVKKIYLLIVSILIMLSSYFFYHTPRVFLPAFLMLFFLFTFFQSKTSINKERINKTLGILTVFVILITAMISLTNFGSGRFGQTSIFYNQEIFAKISALSNEDKGEILIARVFHNKPLVFTKEIVDQYLSYFSTEFLYISGGLPERYVVPEHGLFYYVELPFLILGFYFLVRKRPRFYFLPLIWVICGPLAASVTLEDSPNIQRSLFMLPGFQIIEAYGIYYAYYFFKGIYRSIYIALLIIVFCISLVFFFHQYEKHSILHNAFLRNAGMEELFDELRKRQDNFDKIYLSSVQDIPIYYLFYNYTSHSPFYVPQGEKNFEIGKYNFVDHECPEVIVNRNNFTEKSLIVSYYGCKNVDFLNNIKSTRRNDGSEAFILRVKK